jgi:glycerol kinase
MTILIGVDQGTSGTRAVAFDERLRPVGASYQPAHVSHPQPGWIEKDADETVATVERALGDLAGQLDGEVAAVGLDNEGETVVAWDAQTLRPLAPAIVWGSRRSQPIVERLEAAGHGPRIQELSGLPLDPYFSATKIRWLVENDDAVAAAAQDGHLRAGTLDAYVCARLGDGARTEPSTAGRTQLQALAAPAPGTPSCSSCTASTPAGCRRSGRRPGTSASWRACRCARCWSTRPRPWPATAACCRGWRRPRTAPASSCYSRPAPRPPGRRAA